MHNIQTDQTVIKDISNKCNYLFIVLCFSSAAINRNSIPPTTTLDGFYTKLDSARNKCWTDVAFWGGVVPGNQASIVWYLNYADLPCFNWGSIVLIERPLQNDMQINVSSDRLKSSPW